MESSSLCLNCSNKGKCAFSSGTERAINFCEEYEFIKGPVRNCKYESEAFEGNQLFARIVEDYGDYTGLCMNCDEKLVCSKDQTHSHLLFCENYS